MFLQSPLDVDYPMDYLNDDTPPAPGMVKTINANGKVEWKRYKQYTKDDILAAIEEVKSGTPKSKKNHFLIICVTFRYVCPASQQEVRSSITNSLR